MPRRKQTKRANGMYEYKASVGRDYQGKPIRKSFYSSISKADAKAKAQEYIINQEAAARTGVITDPQTTTFDEWAQKWLKIYKKPNVSENTYNKTYSFAVNNYLVPYFGKARLIDIKQIDIQMFFAKHADMSESLLHKLHITLCGIFEAAIENDMCFKNPAKHVIYTSTAEKQEKQVYSESQLTFSEKYFINDFFDVYFILETGVRRGELLGLMWEDIDFEKKTLRIERSIAEKKGGGVDVRPPKWNSYRTIPISTQLCEDLKNIPHTSAYVFPNENNRVQTPRSWDRKFKRHMNRFTKEHLCMPSLTAHELRHTRGTHLRRNGVDIYTIQRLLGHKDVNVTAQVYVHDDIETTRSAAKIV